MAAHIFQNNHEISKQEIQTALAKAVEMRTLHATLLHGNSPASTRFPTSASPSIPCSSNLYSAQDYPVFMPVNMTLFSGIFCFCRLILHGLHLVGILFLLFSSTTSAFQKCSSWVGSNEKPESFSSCGFELCNNVVSEK